MFLIPQEVGAEMKVRSHVKLVYVSGALLPSFNNVVNKEPSTGGWHVGLKNHTKEVGPWKMPSCIVHGVKRP